MDFTTAGMSLEERYDILNKVDLSPIGKIGDRAGECTEQTEQIVVEEANQILVTMFWNCLYFLDEEQADCVTSRAHADYDNWMFSYLD